MLPGLLLFVLCASRAYGLAIDLCSLQNLGSGMTSNNFMSNGLCHDTCSGKGAAVAITNGHDCWCGSQVPASTEPISDCNTPCPGFGSEMCGGNGVYGYVILGNPSTSSASSSSSSSTSSSTSTVTPTHSSLSDATSTTSSSSNSGSSSSSTVASSSSSSSRSSSSSDSSQGSSSTSVTLQATTVFSTKTVDGSSRTDVIKTEFVTASPTLVQSASASSTSDSSSSSSSNGSSTSKNAFFDSKGKVAGTFTAVGVVALGLVAGFFYCCCGGSRHNDEFSDEENQYSSDEMSITHQKVAAAASSGKHSSGTSTPLKRDNSTKSMLSMFSAAASPSSPIGRSSSRKKLNPKNTGLNGLDSGGDQGMMFPITEFDLRLDLRTMFMNNDDSNPTLGDEHDYSRRILHIANPE